MKKLLRIYVLSILFCLAIAGAAYAEVSVAVDGQLISFPDQKAYIDGANRLMVPVRFVTERLGATVDTDFNDPSSQKVYITKGETKIVLTIGQKAVTVNGENKEMDTAAVLSGGRTMVPIRFVSEYLGSDVQYQSSSQVAHVFTKGQEQQEQGKIMNDICNEIDAVENAIKNLDQYVVGTETHDRLSPKTVTTYRKDTLPVDMGVTTVLKMEKANYYNRPVLRITVDKEPPAPVLRVYLDRDYSMPAVVNVRTNSAFEANNDGTYYCDIYLGPNTTDLSKFKELTFQNGKNEKVFIINNPYYKG